MNVPVDFFDEIAQKSANLQEVVADIYHMGAQILLHDEGDEKFDDGGVSIQMFIPFTTE